MSGHLKKAIERTMQYGKKYGVNYGPKEIQERLISNRVFKEEEIEKELNKLRVTSYELRINSDGKMKKVKELAKLLNKYFKDILMVGVTGSVAAGYPKKDDDIDLMVVTKKDRLWLTRLLLRIFVCIWKIPHRKYGGQEKKDEFCFNLWLEEDVLELPKNRQTLHNAMDAILMKPILNRQKIYERFMRENKWIKKYLINSYVKNN